MVVGNATARWLPSAGQSLILRGGGASLAGDFIPFYRTPFDFKSWYADLQYQHDGLLAGGDHLELRAFYRGDSLDMQLVVADNLPAAPFDVTEHASVVSALYRVAPHEALTMTLGAEGELQRFASPFLDAQVSGLEYVSGFGQLQWRPADQLIATAGLRVVGELLPADSRLHLVPKVSLVWMPHPRHSLRLSAGQAFQNPSLLEAYGAVRVLDGALGVLRGDPTILNGRATQVDLGWQYSVPRLLGLRVNLFWARLEDKLDLGADPSPDWLYVFINGDQDEESIGGELSATWTPLTWLGLKAAYALILDRRPFYDDVPALPFHKAYLTLNTSPLPGLSADLHFFALSFYAAKSPVSDLTVVNPVELLNLRVAYQVLPGLSVTLVGYNLLDADWGQRLRAGAVDTESQVPGSDHIGRRVMLGIEAEL